MKWCTAWKPPGLRRQRISMTTAEGKRIAPDNALVINAADLGITETGPELEKLFGRFLAPAR